MSYVYIKNNSPQPRLGKGPKKIIATSLFIGGSLLFLSAIYPILSFQFQSSFRFNQIISPLSSKIYHKQGSILGELTTDYTQLNNWFYQPITQTNNQSSNNSTNSYKIAIPKLKIDSAEVGEIIAITGVDL